MFDKVVCKYSHGLEDLKGLLEEEVKEIDGDVDYDQKPLWIDMRRNY
jgi:hypothetical protein